MTCNINNLGSSTEVNFIALFRLVTSTFNLTNTSVSTIVKKSDFISANVVNLYLINFVSRIPTQI